MGAEKLKEEENGKMTKCINHFGDRSVTSAPQQLAHRLGRFSTFETSQMADKVGSMTWERKN